MSYRWLFIFWKKKWKRSITKYICTYKHTMFLCFCVWACEYRKAQEFKFSFCWVTKEPHTLYKINFFEKSSNILTRLKKDFTHLNVICPNKYEEWSITESKIKDLLLSRNFTWHQEDICLVELRTLKNISMKEKGFGELTVTLGYPRNLHLHQQEHAHVE